MQVTKHMNKQKPSMTLWDWEVGGRGRLNIQYAKVYYPIFPVSNKKKDYGICKEKENEILLRKKTVNRNCVWVSSDAPDVVI